MSGLLTLLTTALAAAAFTAIVIATVALARDRRLDVRRGLSLATLSLVAAGAVTVGIANTLPTPESGAGRRPLRQDLRRSVRPEALPTPRRSCHAFEALPTHRKHGHARLQR
jgi:hypothetical protein